MKHQEIRQVAERESTETILNIDYSCKVLNIYSNRATVVNRILRKGYEPSQVFRLNGEIEGMEFEVPTKDIGRFMRAGIFKFG